jgi:hypothetical protein
VTEEVLEVTHGAMPDFYMLPEFKTVIQFSLGDEVIFYSDKK